MATATARSPSPAGPGARPGCAAVRRSADSRPASPCDSPLRSSAVCRNAASPRASWCAEKENSDQRGDAAAARTPKPAARPVVGGGAKNFMAPTISAASKASPRKKVLGERNEQQLHPVASSSPVKPMGAPPASEAAGAPRRLRLSFDGAAPPASTPVAVTGSRHSVGGDERKMVENPPCKIHHHAAVSDDAASLETEAEAEPYQAGAAAAYDPKTNYLSPRPRFLHYKPNPRIEQYRQGSTGVRRLEDGFASESSEETITTTSTTSEEEEELTEEEQGQAQLLYELGDDTAVPAADACALPLDPASDSPRARVLTPDSATRSRVDAPETESSARSVQAPPKKRSSLRLLVAPLALVLFMSAALICVPPPLDSPVMPRTSLSKVSDFLSVQELHPVEFAAWLKQWSSSSLNLVTSYWESLVWSQEQEFFGPHFAANLSAAAASADEGVDIYCNFVEARPVLMEDIGVSAFEQDLQIQEAVSASESELISEINYGEHDANPGTSVIEEGNENVDGFLADLEMPKEDAGMSEEVPGSNGEEMASFSQNLEPSEPTTGEAEPLENIESNEPSLEQGVQTDNSEGDRADGGEEHPPAYHGANSEFGMWPGYLDKISKPAAIGVALAAIVVPAALAFLLMRKRQTQVCASADAPPAEQAEQIVEALSGSGSSEGHLRVKGSQHQTPVADEPERFGGSGASMYSSSLSSGHGRRRNVKEDETMSTDPVSRRDSAAYSTSSYGSFTTYEKIPAKKRNKEDEAMTPVRRSSRLRNQVKSPEA
ncbi:uncharacterized protein LOC102708976 [Oryza brachyantha]|uniref:uncharacterized protein LOC102708976 n=1 Tax=Oryza brachyantha TaxID=4533 RepID=UPI001ADC4C5F|nr:uncharacterized protein LOC102708976 [Oryza brachyantha]